MVSRWRMKRAVAVLGSTTIPWIAGLAEQRVPMQARRLVRIAVEMDNAPDTITDLLIKWLISSFGLQSIWRNADAFADMIVSVHLVCSEALRQGIRALNEYLVQPFVV